MTISVETSRIEYTGNGSTTVFPYTWLIYDQAHLTVYVNGVLKTITTHYTVSGVGNDAGGNVTMLTAPANGEVVIILRATPYTQVIDYTANDAFPAGSHEKGLDRIVQQVLQLKERLGRAIKFKTTSLKEEYDMPEPSALMVLRYNADASALEAVSGAVAGGGISLPWQIGDGGTGATNATNARTNLGLGSVAVENTPLDPSKGGTGQAGGYAIGDLIQATAAAVMSKLAAVADGNVLRSAGVGVANLWGKVRLSGSPKDITGTLGTADGGTGANTVPDARTNLGLGTGTIADGDVLMGHGANASYSRGQLAAGTGIAITPSAGGISIATSGASAQPATGIFRNLHLRTHPEADVAASRLWFKADEIVMDNGEKVSSWPITVIDIAAAAGAGALDTGSEVASTWYEAYAIRKSSDGTRNGLLHRAKDYFLDQSQVDSDGASVLRAGATSNVKLAQEFQVATAGLVEFVDVNLLRAGAPTGEVWLTIEGNSGGFPSGTPLATSRKMNAALFATAEQRTRFIFDSPASLATSTIYHLVLQGNYTPSAVNHLLWRIDASSPAYANGTGEAFDGTVWADGANDFTFRIYVTRNNTAVTMPTGYDQRCLIGYVYNGSGSNFETFIARDRVVAKHEGIIVFASITATVPALLDIPAVVPPGTLEVWLHGENNTVAASVVGAPVPDGYGGTGGLRSGGAARMEAGAGGQDGPMGSIMTDFQGIYVSVSAGTGAMWATGYRW